MILKNIILIFFIIIIYVLIGNVFSDNIKIPDESIRFRILANSNSNIDQEIKDEISIKIGERIYNLLKNAENIEDARKIINSSIIDIEKILKEYDIKYNIKYGENYFPKKEYKGIVYEEGFYESLLVTLGKGLGENWWCVLFPPLCLLEAEESDTYEYKLFIKEIIDKYL